MNPSEHNDSTDEQQLGDVIEPVDFRPSSATTVAAKRKRVKPITLALSIVGVLLAAVLWFVFSAKAVLIQIQPTPDSMMVEGGTLKFELGGRHMLRTGQYLLRAQKQGFYPLEQEFQVGRDQNQELTFDLKLLPGRLNILSEPEQVSVFVNQEDRGQINSLELDKGEYEVTLRARGYLDHQEKITIQGRSIEQQITASLTPAWAPVTLTSTPPGANVSIDDEVIGQTPVTSDIPAGSHLVTIDRPGYKTWRSDLSVQANVPMELPNVRLEKADGTISVSSKPTGASVTVAGKYYGVTPIKLKLRPGSSYKVALSKAGFKPSSRNIDVRSNQGQSISLNLVPNIGVVRFVSVPTKADIYVDGQLKGQSGQKIELPAVTQTVEFRKTGFAPFRVDVTPRPGFDQSVTAQLKTLEESKWAAVPKTITATGDIALQLLRPNASFNLGASRREAGRRANEGLRPVRLERPFYVSTDEITNLQFRYFRKSHVSGESKNSALNENDRPASHLSWEDAARFCNWLSQQANLAPAYQEENGKMVAASPMTNGYRLPTEAEWAWIARYAGRTTARRYPWGNSLPPEPESGNYADNSAKQLVSKTVDKYDDHYPSVAPVGSFAPNRLGFRDLSGNVSEWIHDYYVIGAVQNPDSNVDPLGPKDGAFHVIRGSSWMHGSPVELRWAYRDYGKDSRSDLGFRVARYVE